MAVFKCKMCGGTLEIQENQTVGVCEYCGTKQTLPKLDDDRKVNLYDRANHFRRNNEFDKAISIYEQILNDDRTDAEAYWSMVICRYGIEYVEEPGSHRRVPTVNRTQYTSIYMDEDYKSAIQYADEAQRVVYEQEAKEIDTIQKGILEVSSKEEPFDVFICYKETDNNGRRTPDSVLANDLYYQLTQEGFKVFFARITLEDKLGSAYEPYIFSALNSAKVMVVLGTKEEYFKAVWVKNEWSRYLEIVKKSQGKKTLIPAYRDMDPYDLPEEFSHLQAQDMSKLGFMQDLIRGIKKIIGNDSESADTQKVEVKGEQGGNLSVLVKRGELSLEDAEWDRAKEFFDRALDIDAECAEAYLGLAMADNEIPDKDEFEKAYITQEGGLVSNKRVLRARKFADSEMLKWFDKLDELYRQETEKIERQRREEEERIQKEKLEEEARLQRERELAEQKKKQLEKAKKQYELYSKRLIACEDHTVALRYDNTVLACGENKLGACNVEKWHDIKMIVAFFDTTVAVNSEGYVKSVGLISDDKIFCSKSIKKIECGNFLIGVLDEDELHLISKGYSNVVYNVKDWGELKDFTIGRDLIIGLTPDGKVLVTGDSEIVENTTKNWHDIEKISNYFYSYSDNYTFGFRNDGTIISPDLDLSGVKDVSDIKIAEFFAACLTYTGRIIIIGQVEKAIKDAQEWNDVIGIAAGKGHLVGLKADGTVSAVGDNTFGQCDVNEWRDIIFITACGNHTIGLKADGTFVATGDNTLGQCNVQNWKLFYLPEEIPDRIQELSREKVKLNEELGNLHGIFAKKRKNEIENLLDKLENEMELLKTETNS